MPGVPFHPPAEGLRRHLQLPFLPAGHQHRLVFVEAHPHGFAEQLADDRLQIVAAVREQRAGHVREQQMAADVEFSLRQLPQQQQAQQLLLAPVEPAFPTVLQHRLDGGAELLQLQGLEYVMAHSVLHRPLGIVEFPECAVNHAVQPRLVLLRLPNKLQPVLLRHADVGKQDVHPLAVQHLHRLLHRFRHAGLDGEFKFPG